MLCGPFAMKFIMGLRLCTNENGMAVRPGRPDREKEFRDQCWFYCCALAMGIYEIPSFSFIYFGLERGPVAKGNGRRAAILCLCLR